MFFLFWLFRFIFTSFFRNLTTTRVAKVQIKWNNIMSMIDAQQRISMCNISTHTYNICEIIRNVKTSINYTQLIAIGPTHVEYHLVDNSERRIRSLKSIKMKYC